MKSGFDMTSLKHRKIVPNTGVYPDLLSRYRQQIVVSFQLSTVNLKSLLGAEDKFDVAGIADTHI
jgi:hypothetical protein